MEMGNTHIPESDNHRLMEHQQPQSFLLGLWVLKAPGVRLPPVPGPSPRGTICPFHLATHRHMNTCWGSLKGPSMSRTLPRRNRAFCSVV